MSRRKLILSIFCLYTSFLCVPLSAFFAPSCLSMPLRPDLVDRLKAEGRLEEEGRIAREAYDRGVNHPPAVRPLIQASPSPERLLGTSATLTVERNAIVILVDFSDNTASTATYPPSHYSEMLFSEDSYPTRSMRDYYIENSYGQFAVGGAVTQWLRMPQTYAYYVDGQRGLLGAYPNNARKLAEDAVLAADAYVDFSQFDNDGPDGVPNSGDDDGYVDAVFVVHAGKGYEETLNPNHIHSHQWSTKSPITVDGVKVSTYSMEPDNGKIGVFSHEFGHVLGLPDLYDSGYDARGLGYWSVMAGGSWGNGGLTPTHFDAWSKSKLGFVTPQVCTTNVAAVSLPNAETSPTSYVVWTNGVYSREYFMVENRQQTLFDSYLLGSGLVVYHVDEEALGNNSQCCGACVLHCIVAVEQADGECDLENNTNSGDTGDPFPGSGGANNPNHVFDYSSTPNSRDYSDNDTQVAMDGITLAGGVVQMGVTVETLPAIKISGKAVHDTLALGSGNGDGILDPGETIDLSVELNNYGIDAEDVRAGLHTSDVFVTLISDTSAYGAIPANEIRSPEVPFELSLSSTCPIPHGIILDMNISGSPDYSVSRRFFVGVGDTVGFYDWGHSAVKDGYEDQWHLSTEKNHTTGDASCWKCGSTVLDNYANLMDAALYTTPFYVTEGTELTFWHWMEAEYYNASVAWDGGVVEISVAGGPWQIITPSGGYPYTMKACPECYSPFPAGTPCFSGISGVWKYERFILSGYPGPARVRFRFGTDVAETYRGWYIDDVALTNAQLTSVSEQSPPEVPTSLLAAYPNPFNPLTTIKFSVAANEGPAHLFICDVSGRLVKRLVDKVLPAGLYEVRWDGRDRRGSQVAGGIYLCRLETDRTSRAVKLVVLR
ncbi:MAG: M6 family metalloprotease domain-containing protein [Candidatus Eisenbacteria bacterium]|nr:M6 family metalloprotease domain-containing protein [Candidatus Eisenbacteria bacterium]